MFSLPKLGFKNHIIALALLTILSVIIVILQFKNLNNRIHRLERSVNSLSTEWTTMQLKQQNAVCEKPEVESTPPLNNNIQQLQNEYKEYQYGQEQSGVEESNSLMVSNGEELNEDPNTVEQPVGDTNEDTQEDTQAQDTAEINPNLEGVNLEAAKAAILRQENTMEDEINLGDEDEDEGEGVEGETVETDINSLTVTQLKELIREKGGSIPRKVVKADLVNIYQQLA